MPARPRVINFGFTRRHGFDAQSSAHPAEGSLAHGDVSEPRQRSATRDPPRPDPRRRGGAQKKAQNTHLQQGLQRGISTRPRQLIESRGAVGEAADRLHLFAEQPHGMRRRHKAVEKHRLYVVNRVVNINSVLPAVPRALLKQTRQAQLGLGARQQLLVPEGVAPDTTDGRPRRVAEPV